MIPLENENNVIPHCYNDALIPYSNGGFTMLPSIFGERLFDDFFADPFMPAFVKHDPVFGKHAKNVMKTDVRETENTYELDIDLPGFKKDEVQIELDGGYLTINATKATNKDEEGKNGQYLRRERYSGECSRSFYVGEALEPKDVSAAFEDGILKISFPKAPEKKIPEKKTIAIA